MNGCTGIRYHDGDCPNPAVHVRIPKNSLEQFKGTAATEYYNIVQVSQEITMS